MVGLRVSTSREMVVPPQRQHFNTKPDVPSRIKQEVFPTLIACVGIRCNMELHQPVVIGPAPDAPLTAAFGIHHRHHQEGIDLSPFRLNHHVLSVFLCLTGRDGTKP